MTVEIVHACCYAVASVAGLHPLPGFAIPVTSPLRPTRARARPALAPEPAASHPPAPADAVRLHSIRPLTSVLCAAWGPVTLPPGHHARRLTSATVKVAPPTVQTCTSAGFGQCGPQHAPAVWARPGRERAAEAASQRWFLFPAPRAA